MGRLPRFTAEPALEPLGPVERRLLDRFSAETDPARLRRRLAELPAPRHRASDPARMEAAERVVAGWFSEAGWPADRQPFDGGANLVATRGGDERTALLVIAHLDTVAGSGGADDNGSGVVALAEVARLLSPFRFRRSIVLAAVDLEESGGFAGTEALVADLRDRREIAGGIVLETIAFTDARPNTQRIPPGLGVLYPGQLRRARAVGMAATWTLTVYRATALPLARAFGEALVAVAGNESAMLVRDPLDLPVVGRLLPYAVPTVRHFARSDHVALWRHGIPAILVTDTADLRNPAYHTPFDLPATLDHRRLADTATATALAIHRLAGGSGE